MPLTDSRPTKYRYDDEQIPWFPPESIAAFPDLLAVWHTVAGDVLRRVSRLHNGLQWSNSPSDLLSELVIFRGAIDAIKRPSQTILEELAADRPVRVCRTRSSSCTSALWLLAHDLRQFMGVYGFAEFYTFLRDVVPPELSPGDSLCFYVLSTALAGRECSGLDKTEQEWLAAFKKLKEAPDLQQTAASVHLALLTADLWERVRGFKETRVGEKLKAEFRRVARARRLAMVRLSDISSCNSKFLHTTRRRQSVPYKVDDLDRVLRLVKQHERRGSTTKDALHDTAEAMGKSFSSVKAMYYRNRKKPGTGRRSSR